MSIVRFAHLSDTHIGPTADDELYGTPTAPRLVRLVEHFNGLSDELDFVVHTGDVVRDPDEASYRLAADILSDLELPIYLCNGNHDSASLLNASFPRPGQQLASDDRYAYRFETKGHRFVVLDARGPDAIDPHGRMDLPQLDALRRTLADRSMPTTVFLHFPALPLDCDWVDRMMLIENGDALHGLLSEHATQLRGVFFGHVHRATQTWADGVLYVSSASSFCQFQNHPSDEQMFPSTSLHAFYNLVTLTPRETRVRQHFC